MYYSNLAIITTFQWFSFKCRPLSIRDCRVLQIRWCKWIIQSQLVKNRKNTPIEAVFQVVFKCPRSPCSVFIRSRVYLNMYVILLILLECDIEDKYVTCEYVTTHAFDYNLVYLLRAIRLFFYPYANKYCRKFYSQTISVNDL